MRYPSLSVGEMKTNLILGPGAIPFFRRKIFLDPSNGSDGYSGLSIESPKKTLAAAWAMVESGKNDVIFLVGGASGVSLLQNFNWNKNCTHLIGLAAGSGLNSRARMSRNAVFTGGLALFTVSGYGCLFHDIYWFDGFNDTTPPVTPVAVEVTGNRNVFKNCHIAGIGDDTFDVNGAYSLKVNGAQECLFDDCFIGLDTIARGSASGGTGEINFASAASRITFKDCVIFSLIEHATYHAMVRCAAGGYDRFIRFKNCEFIAESVNQGYAMASVFKVAASALTCNPIILKDCMAISGKKGTDAVWDVDTTSLIWANMPASADDLGGGIGEPYIA